MALPLALDLVNVRGKYVRLDNTSVEGSVLFTMTAVLTDAASLLTAADTSDQLHPTTGPGSGSEKWGLGLYAAITQ